MIRVALALVALAAAAAPAPAQVRVKDVTDIFGANANQLFGYGLVVGLDGTGSRSTFTQQVAVDMLQRLGTTAQIFSQLPADAVIRSTSISAVMVMAEIGPFTRKGGRLDVTVSCLDDARSLQGGTLLFTPLTGVDGQTYISAQGPLSVGGFSVSGAAAGVQKNQLNTGRIPNGGIVVKEAPGTFVTGGKAHLILKSPDFNTARLLAKAVNERFPFAAQATDAGTVTLCCPTDGGKTPVQFLGEVGLIEFRPDSPARVVINERTGTVVAGEHVTLSSCSVTHGNLYVGTSETPVASQPAPLSGGATAVLPRTQAGAREQASRMVVLPPTTTVADVARALNALGVTPRDLISIFQALKQAGALHAELVII
jgi:flagellar P-ring protein precursor FlgI